MSGMSYEQLLKANEILNGQEPPKPIRCPGCNELSAGTVCWNCGQSLIPPELMT